MSTPTPPVAAPVPPGAEPAQPGLSQVARIINTFIAPRKTFLDIRRSASWWLPFILLAVATTAFIFVVNRQIGADAVVNNRFSHASFLQRATSRITPEQQQKMVADQVRGQNRSVYYASINVIVAALVLALLLWPTFNVVFEAGIKYKTVLAVVLYGWLPKIGFTALAIIVMMIGVEPEGFDIESPVATNLGVLLGSNTDQRHLYRLLGGFDLFSFWWIFLVGLGLATVSQKKIGTGAAVAVVAAWYALFILLRVALAPIMS